MAKYIITGVSSGLGMALAECLTGKSYDVIGIGRSEANEAGICAKHFKFIKCDLSISNDYDKLCDTFELDGEKSIKFISNAGVIAPIRKLSRLDHALRSHFEVNFFSVIGMVSALVNLAEKKGFKLHIVNITSGAANHPIEGWGAYCASKAAVKMWLDTNENNQFIAKIDHVDPGVMDTPMQKEICEAGPTQFPKVNDFISLRKEGKLDLPLTAANKILTALDLCI